MLWIWDLNRPQQGGLLKTLLKTPKPRERGEGQSSTRRENSGHAALESQISHLTAPKRDKASNFQQRFPVQPMPPPRCPHSFVLPAACWHRRRGVLRGRIQQVRPYSSVLLSSLKLLSSFSQASLNFLSTFSPARPRIARMATHCIVAELPLRGSSPVRRVRDSFAAASQQLRSSFSRPLAPFQPSFAHFSADPCMFCICSVVALCTSSSRSSER